jgi:hypothetical protein
MATAYEALCFLSANSLAFSAGTISLFQMYSSNDVNKKTIRP